ncbi:hypothetical protein J6590_071029 [Homalodisca vitripennis]|nr:hypothetical protein J6590_071029 [Homalodisca vitripennis]
MKIRNNVGPRTVGHVWTVWRTLDTIDFDLQTNKPGLIQRSKASVYDTVSPATPLTAQDSTYAPKYSTKCFSTRCQFFG